MEHTRSRGAAILSGVWAALVAIAILSAGGSSAAAALVGHVDVLVEPGAAPLTPTAKLYAAGTSAATDRTQNEGPAAPDNAAVESIGELNWISESLIEKAASGRTPATEFRIQATLYRERLRKLMLEDRKRPDPQRLPDDMLVDMVRMSALLHAASACRTGHVITCPADLMLQLRSQQSVTVDKLAELRAAMPAGIR